jgi:signal transduction histidine kinase
MAQPDKLAGASRRGRAPAEAELAADLSPDLLLLVDDRDRIVYANARLRELLGFHNFPFLTLDQLLESPELAVLRSLLRRVAEGNVVPALALNWRRQEGGVCPLEVRVSRRGRHTVISARPPASREGLELQLAEQARVARRVSHDLRNLSTYVVAGSEMLNRPGAEVTSTLRGLLDRFVQDTEAYLCRLDDFARPLKPLSAVDADELVAAAIRAAQTATAAAARSVLYTADPAPPIAADRERLEAAFTALLTSALQAVPAGAYLRVSLTSEVTGVQVRVMLPIALKPSELEEQLANVNFSLKSGAGYNYPLAARLVALHGGRLRVDAPAAAPGATEFVIALPAAGKYSKGHNSGWFVILRGAMLPRRMTNLPHFSAELYCRTVLR